MAKHEQMTKVMGQLNDMRNLFYSERDHRLQEDLQWQTLEATFGSYPTVNYPGWSAIESLRERIQKESLYVLSHLELQNQNPDLIF